MTDKIIPPGQQEPVRVNEKISWTAGKEKALALIKRLVPEQYGFYSDQNLTEPVYSDDVKMTVKEHYYNFTRVVNGILFRDNSMSLSLDRETGEVRSFYLNWSDLDFPGVTDIITESTASDSYFDGTGVRLSYFQKKTYDKTNGAEITDPAAKLVYSLVRKGYPPGGGIFVDAVTGKALDWNGREIASEDTDADPKLSDHWAERSVELLVSQGIIKKPICRL